MLLRHRTAFHANPCRFLGSPAIGFAWVSAEQTGPRRNFQGVSEARVSNVTNRAATPSGYLHPVAWLLPIKPGGLASRGRILGVGVVTGSMAAGRNLSATVTGSGLITNAALGLIVSAVATLSNASAVTANIVGAIQGSATLTGSSAVTAALGAIAGLAAALTGSNNVVANITAKGSLSADIDSTGSVLTTANVGDAVWKALCEGALTYEDVMRILLAVAAGKTTITDLGGGDAEVVFRDQADTKDRVFAEMTGSERTNVVLDPS